MTSKNAKVFLTPSKTAAEIISTTPETEKEIDDKKYTEALTTFIQENPEMNNFLVLYSLCKQWHSEDLHKVIIPAMIGSKKPFVEYDDWYEAFCGGKQEEYTEEEAKKLIKRGMKKYIRLFLHLVTEEWNELSDDCKLEEAMDLAGIMTLEWKLKSDRLEPIYEHDDTFIFPEIMVKVINKFMRK